MLIYFTLAMSSIHLQNLREKNALLDENNYPSSQEGVLGHRDRRNGGVHINLLSSELGLGGVRFFSLIATCLRLHLIQIPGLRTLVCVRGREGVFL